MQTNATVHSPSRKNAGFTLVELLTVIAIIAILAAMLMTVIPAIIKAAKIRKATLEMGQIALGIQGYETAYGHLPVSHAVQAAANPDFTYGGTFRTASGTAIVGTPLGATVLQNDQIVAVLMNFAVYPGTSTPTANPNFQANINKTPYLNASYSGDASSSGVGTDLVYRDPWGDPYVISLDLNDDGACEDALYCAPVVSAGNSDGLILQPDGRYAFHGKVMVWSAGPDGKVNPARPGKSAENTDNVLSWH